MKNVNVKLEKVSYEKVMGMKEQMMIKKNGMVVLILGWDKMREKKYEGDWREVERKDGVIKYERENRSWSEGKVMYCVVNEIEKEYGMKWLKIVVEDKFGEKVEREEGEESIENDENLKRLNELADEGNVEAMFYLANFYFVPDGPLKQNYTRARELYEGICRLFVERKLEESERYYVDMSRTQLGFMYMRGLGVEPDYKRAFKHFHWAARKGIAQAMFNLGLMYLTSDVVECDFAKAEQWLKLAAENGIAQADVYLKRMNSGESKLENPQQDPTLLDAKIEDDIFIWQVVSVSSSDEGTKVVKCVIPKVSGTIIWSDWNERLIDPVIGMKYCIADSELPMSSKDGILLTNTEPFYFTEIYPPLQFATDYLDIENGGGEYYIRNWKVKK